MQLYILLFNRCFSLQFFVKCLGFFKRTGADVIGLSGCGNLYILANLGIHKEFAVTLSVYNVGSFRKILRCGTCRTYCGKVFDIPEFNRGDFALFYFIFIPQLMAYNRIACVDDLNRSRHHDAYGDQGKESMQQ